MTDDEADMYYDRWLVAKNRIKQLEDGIMDMKQTIANKEAELNDCNLSFNAQVEENYLQSLDIERLETEIERLNKDKIIDDLKATMRDAMFQINCEDPWQAYEILEEAVEK